MDCRPLSLGVCDCETGRCCDVCTTHMKSTIYGVFAVVMAVDALLINRDRRGLCHTYFRDSVSKFECMSMFDTMYAMLLYNDFFGGLQSTRIEVSPGRMCGVRLQVLFPILFGV